MPNRQGGFPAVASPEECLALTSPFNKCEPYRSTAHSLPHGRGGSRVQNDRNRGADPLALNHSYRMALTGSRWAARLEGSQQAKTPTEAKVKDTARMTDGSERKPPFGIEAMR